jgi:murein endopeptidase
MAAWRPSRPLRTGLLTLPLLLALAAPGLAEERASSTANALFGAVSRATSDRRAEVIGGYTRGCIRGAVELPADGPAGR